jgi:hypothetical protein
MNMPLVEYLLLAILGSAPIAPGSSNNVSLRTYGAESVSQPGGSTPAERRYCSVDKNASNSNKKATTGNSNSKKPPEKGKKNSGGTSTPPPK